MLIVMALSTMNRSLSFQIFRRPTRYGPAQLPFRGIADDEQAGVLQHMGGRMDRACVVLVHPRLPTNRKLLIIRPKPLLLPLFPRHRVP